MIPDYAAQAKEREKRRHLGRAQADRLIRMILAAAVLVPAFAIAALLFAILRGDLGGAP
jgi:hypothetical protein